MKKVRKTPLVKQSVEPEMCSIGMRLDILSRVPFFTGLSLESMNGINLLFREQGFSAGETVYFSGDPATRLYVVASGKVKLLRHTSAGKNVMMDLLVPGEFFGSLSSLGEAEYAETAQAHTQVCTLGIGAEEFRQILDANPSVAVRVLDVMSERLHVAHERIQHLSTSPVETRIANTLLHLAEKMGEKKEAGLVIQTPLSRDDLAEMAGTTTETASRVVSQFKKDGLIRTGRQWVALRNLSGLKEIGKEKID